MSDLTHANSEETFLSRLWRRVRGVSEPNLRESIEDALDETEEEGTEFSLEERHMLRNLLGFRDVRVDDVMVPRADISAIDLATFGDDVLAVFVDSGHSRLPVYRETLDSPVGMLHLKDVIAARRERAKAADIEQIMRDVLFVPPSMPALQRASSDPGGCPASTQGPPQYSFTTKSPVSTSWPSRIALAPSSSKGLCSYRLSPLSL